MSVLRYNGVSLPFVVTDVHEMTPEWTPDGADYLYTRGTLQITSTLTAHTPGFLNAGETLAHAVQRIRHMLEQPRQALYYSHGGQAYAVTATEDVRNGPFPKLLAVVKTIDSEAVVLQFRVEFAVRECDGKDPNSLAPYLSHRWEETAEIDQDFYTVRTRTGVLEIPSGRGLVADSFRHVVCPPIPEGFVRETSRYTVRSDGLALQFEFRDKEVSALPPKGCTRAGGTYKKLTVGKGNLVYGEVSVKLVGSRNANKQEMIAQACKIAIDKLDKEGLIREGPRGPRLIGSIEEQLFDNEVTVHLRGLLRPKMRPRTVDMRAASPGQLLDLKFTPQNVKPGESPTKIPGNSGGRLDNVPVPKLFGTPSAGLPYPITRETPDPGFRGTAGLRLAAAALNDPCLVVALNVSELRAGEPLPQVQELKGEPGRELQLIFPAPTLPAAASGTPTGSSALAGLVAAGQALQPGGPANPGVPLKTQAPGADLDRDFRTGLTARSSVRPALVYVAEQLPQKRSDDVLSGGPYSYYQLSLRYVRDQQNAILPEQKVGGLTRFPKLAATTLMLEVEWTAERVGEPPISFDPDLNNSNYELLDEVINPGTLDDVSDDGITLTYRLGGVNRYGVVDPSVAKLGAGVVPWMADLMGLPGKPTVIGGPVVINDGTTIRELRAGQSLNLNPLPEWEQNLRAFLNGLLDAGS